jgi:DNA modification methylase
MKDEYFGELEQIMPTLPSDSVRMIFADFPFNTTNAKWDTPVDLEIFWLEAWRILKDNGVVIAKAQVPFNIILGASQIKHLKYEWVWEKTAATGGLNCKKMPMKASENLMVFYKKLPLYNPQKTEGHSPVNSFTKKKSVADKCELYNKNTKDVSGGGNTDRYPRNVLKFSSDKQRLAVHPTQTPEALVEYFIKTYTDEGDAILDPCRGVNTTGVCADRLNRKAILIEKDKYFYKLGLLRREFPQLKTKELLAKYDQL